MPKNKYIVFPVKSQTSRQKISNNIKEKLFISNVYAYKAKQKKLQTDCMELIKIYDKLTKKKSVSKILNVEDIEQVVS